LVCAARSSLNWITSVDPIAVVMLITCFAIAATSTGLTSSLNWITFVISVAVIAFIIVTGSAHADLANMIALIQPQTGTPVNATIFVTGASACIALFSSLDVLATVSSVSTLFIFMLMVVALLVRSYYVREALVPLLHCIVMLITCSTMTKMG
ncbi:hypothetical protein Taro_054682, partial [Colocasia esculenta]|nr:hypothetical protein [Colocasia esculenta]